MALKEHDQLPSNFSYKSALEKYQKISELFGTLTLSQRILGLTYKTIHMMVEDLKIILYNARDGSLSSNIIPSLLGKLVKLSKIFSICVSLIYKVSSEKYFKTLINPKMEKFTSPLHFLVRKVEKDYHLAVLISNRHAYKDNFDGEIFKPGNAEMLIKPEPVENYESVQEVVERK